mgnify:CR=1 FL=1
MSGALPLGNRVPSHYHAPDPPVGGPLLPVCVVQPNEVSLRLDRFFSQAAGISRSHARVLIQRGRVRVNGEVVRDAACQVSDRDRVERAGETLAMPQPVYLMLNKPCGLLNIRGYFDLLESYLDHAVNEGFLRPENREMLLTDDDPESLVRQFARYTPASVEKWQ